MTRSTLMVNFVALSTLAFLYLPLAAVAFFSVNSTKYGLVWNDFTLDWYLKLFQNQVILNAAWNTLILALISTLVATVMGTALAIGIDRFPWPGKTETILDMILHVPVIIPDIILAAALVVIFNLMRLFSSWFEPGLLTMVIGHITFQIAFVTLVVRSRLVAMNPEIEEVARDLFATTPYLLWHITLPLIMPGIVAGGLLAFTLSLDDFVISFFTAGTDSITLPIYIYAAVRRGVTPEIHALSTIVLFLTVGLVVIAERLTRRMQSA